MSFPQNFTVTLDYFRCDRCARYYAVETGAAYECPYCAKVRINKVYEDLAVVRQHRNGLSTTISRLRGHITKLKKGGAA
jgi:DNA-directed RNA polymerase subunit RPC12/RpoP